MALGIKLGYAFSEKIKAPPPVRTIEVYVDNDFDRLSEWYAKRVGWPVETSRSYWKQGKAVSGMGLMVVKASSSHDEIWQRSEGLTHLTIAVIHEYIHAALQGGVAGFSTDPDGFKEHGSVSTPRWLAEGMAGLLTEMVILDYYQLEYPQPRTRAGITRHVASITDATLEDAEIWPVDSIDQGGRAVISCIYQCGWLATELLAFRVGVRGLVDYYMLLEPAMVPRDRPEEQFPHPGWRTAFGEAFGLTIDEFYQLFERHRAAGFPELEIPKR